jgi:helix-turn-helix protein
VLKSRRARDSLHRILKFAGTVASAGLIDGENVKVTNLAAALKTEVRRLAAKEVNRGLRQVRALQRQIRKLRANARLHRRGLRAVERNFDRLQARMPSTGGRRGRGARLSAEDIRSLRARLGMTREQFARVVQVSPGSIFGWETGRTIPRGRSMSRVLDVRKMGVRKARALGGPAGRPGRPARRAGRRKGGARRARRKKAA